MLHCAHGYHHGMKKIMLHAMDTDVLVYVIAIATASALEGCEIWLAFGHSKNFRYIAAHTIAAELGARDCYSCMPFQAVILSHCSVELERKLFSMFGDLYQAWLATLFGCLSETPEAITDDCMGEIERFVVLLYSRTSQLLTVNAARKQLFSYGNRCWKIFLLPEQLCISM